MYAYPYGTLTLSSFVKKLFIQISTVVKKDFVHFSAPEILNLFKTNILLIKPNKYWFFALNQLVKVDSGALWLTLKNEVYIIWTVLNDLLI